MSEDVRKPTAYDNGSPARGASGLYGGDPFGSYAAASTPSSADVVVEKPGAARIIKPPSSSSAVAALLLGVVLARSGLSSSTPTMTRSRGPAVIPRRAS